MTKSYDTTKDYRDETGAFNWRERLPQVAVDLPNITIDGSMVLPLLTKFLNDGEVVRGFAEGYVENDLNRHDGPMLRAAFVTDQRLLVLDRASAQEAWDITDRPLLSTNDCHVEERPGGSNILVKAEWGVLHIQGVDPQAAEEFKESLWRAALHAMCARVESASGSRAAAFLMRIVEASIPETEEEQPAICDKSVAISADSDPEHGVPVMDAAGA